MYSSLFYTPHFFTGDNVSFEMDQPPNLKWLFIGVVRAYIYGMHNPTKIAVSYIISRSHE